MATQMFQGNTGTYQYTVIDNVAAQTFPTLQNGTHVGYDTMAVVPSIGAAAYQSANFKTNGTIPDFVNNATAISTGLVLTNLSYKNPS